jgi:hypothetical protein
MKNFLVLVLFISLNSIAFSKGDSLLQTFGFHYTMKMSYRNIATSDSELKSDINSKSGYKFADDIGVFYQIVLPSRIGLRMGAKYANKGFNINNYEDFGFTAIEEERYKVGFHNLSFPIQISYHRLNNGKRFHFYPFLEVSYDVLLATTKKTSNFNEPKQVIKPSSSLNDDLRTHNISASFGMGWLYRLNPDWIMGFRAYFTTDILPVYSKSGWDTRLDASAISLEINYVLGNKAKTAK